MSVRVMARDADVGKEDLAVGQRAGDVRRGCPHKPVSGKPLETRMGKGKGEPEYWCAVVKPGTMMFEVAGVDEPTAKRALARVAHKMTVKTRFLARRRAVA